MPAGKAWTAGTDLDVGADLDVRTDRGEQAGDQLGDDCVGLLLGERSGVDEWLEQLAEAFAALGRTTLGATVVGLVGVDDLARRRRRGACRAGSEQQCGGDAAAEHGGGDATGDLPGVGAHVDVLSWPVRGRLVESTTTMRDRYVSPPRAGSKLGKNWSVSSATAGAGSR